MEETAGAMSVDTVEEALQAAAKHAASQSEFHCRAELTILVDVRCVRTHHPRHWRAISRPVSCVARGSRLTQEAHFRIPSYARRRCFPKRRLHAFGTHDGGDSATAEPTHGLHALEPSSPL
jgi:hypothetical protein